MPAAVAVPAHPLLQPQRHQHHVAEEQAVGHRRNQRAEGELRRANRRRSTTRVGIGHLPDQEHGEGHCRDDRQHDDLR
jgi:hypothetical protein